jgi:hypothetical protein
VIWTTPGGSRRELRLTAGTLKPLLFGARSPNLIGAGSQNTAPNRRLVSGDKTLSVTAFEDGAFDSP